jgi:hypothetical protein
VASPSRPAVPFVQAGPFGGQRPATRHAAARGADTEREADGVDRAGLMPQDHDDHKLGPGADRVRPHDEQHRGPQHGPLPKFAKPGQHPPVARTRPLLRAACAVGLPILNGPSALLGRQERAQMRIWLTGTNGEESGRGEGNEESGDGYRHHRPDPPACGVW